jgi:hypothetical protein
MKVRPRTIATEVIIAAIRLMMTLGTAMAAIAAIATIVARPAVM